MKKIYFQFLLLGAISTLSSCLAHYIAPPINNPMLSQEAELMVNGGFCTGEMTASGNVNVAYSPIQNIGVGYSYSGYNANAEVVTNGVSSTYKLFDGAYNEMMAGYYKQFSKHGIVECYGGFGMGGSNNSYNEYSTSNNSTGGSSKLKYTRVFIMPSVGTKYKNFQASFGIKIYQINFYKNELTNVSDAYISDLVNRLNDKPYYFADPAATIKFGHKNFMFFGQLGMCNKISGNIIDYEQLKFSMGLQFQFLTRGPQLRD